MKFKKLGIFFGLFVLLIIFIILFKNMNIFENISNISDLVKNKVQSNLTATSCTQFSNCMTCTKGKVDRTNAPCYWNPKKNECGSFKDPGYYKTCTH